MILLCALGSNFFSSICVVRSQISCVEGFFFKFLFIACLCVCLFLVVCFLFLFG